MGGSLSRKAARIPIRVARDSKRPRQRPLTRAERAPAWNPRRSGSQPSRCHAGPSVGRPHKNTPVHRPEVRGAHAVRRMKDLPRAKWRPANVELARRVTTPRGPADPSHEGRRKDRPRHDGARDPAPCARDESPATIMEGGKSPGLIVNPCPTPGIDPDPMPEGVRGPADRHRGEPDRSIPRHDSPASVAVAGRCLR